ncbi:MAG: hypothetical protein ABIQ64_04460 [Candidatus Saccharimonadales bacterium]
MGNSKMTAITLQFGLIALIVLLVGGIIGIFFLAQTVMSQKALSTDHYRTDAELAQEEIVRLQQLKSILKNDQGTIEKTARIVAQSQQYQFQDQVINDVTSYAKRNNIEVLSFDFGLKPGAAAQDPTSGSTQQKTIVKVQLSNDIPYDSFLRFLKSLEQNITKMQLTGIALQPNVTQPNLILAPTIELEVFLR